MTTQYVSYSFDLCTHSLFNLQWLGSLSVPLTLFTNRAPVVKAIVPNANIVSIELSELPAYQILSNAHQDLTLMSGCTDTWQYAALTHSKLHLMEKALTTTPEVSHTVWLDVGVSRTAYLSEEE